jgi:hypothetical protein
MKIKFITIFFLLCWGELFPQNKEFAKHLKVKVPNEWVSRLRTIQTSKEKIKLLEDFEKIIRPDTLVGTSTTAHLDNAILNPLFINLDSDKGEEIIALFGWTEYYPSLVVFKEINDFWHLIYHESFSMFYTSPVLLVANNYSVNKVFYIRNLTDRGSGIYSDELHFYKVINGEVHPCLNLLNRAHIYGWGLNLNQWTKVDFEFNSASADELWVTYNYNFFAGPIAEGDQPWDGHDEVPFVKGENSVMYKWDTLSLSYEPHFYKNLKEGLTAKKIECFRNFGNDTLFVRAFDYEIKQTLTKGTRDQKKFLQKYLSRVSIK